MSRKGIMFLAKKYIRNISSQSVKGFYFSYAMYTAASKNLRKFKLGKGLLVEVKSTQTGITNSIHPKAWPK